MEEGEEGSGDLSSGVRGGDSDVCFYRLAGFVRPRPFVHAEYLARGPFRSIDEDYDPTQTEGKFLILAWAPLPQSACFFFFFLFPFPFFFFFCGLMSSVLTNPRGACWRRIRDQGNPAIKRWVHGDTHNMQDI